MCTVRDRVFKKNKPEGSKLVRGCWCNDAPELCPVHMMGPFILRRAQGESLFPGVTAAKATRVLRVCLHGLGVPGHEEYRLHDFRRGHAMDLVASGAPLWEILGAGEWRSPAFLQYLNLHELEEGLVTQAHLEESESEDDA